MRTVVFVVLAAGCGRWNFDATSDAAVLDGAGDASTLCDPVLPFGSPVPLGSLNVTTNNDGTLRLARDELTGYFWSYRSGRGEIYYASRTALTDSFAVTVVSGLSNSGNDLDPMLDLDGSFLIYRHNLPGDALYHGVLVDPTTFAGPSLIGVLDSPLTEAQPYFQASTAFLYFQSMRTGSGDLYRSMRAGAGFSAPQLVTELATDITVEGDPVISEDGLTLYFRSDAPAALGGFNIYVTTRTDPFGAFGTPVLVDGVNSSSDDGPSFLSPDHCRLYLSSDRAGTNDIYVATRGT